MLVHFFDFRHSLKACIFMLHRDVCSNIFYSLISLLTTFVSQNKIYGFLDFFLSCLFGRFLLQARLNRSCASSSHKPQRNDWHGKPRAPISNPMQSTGAGKKKVKKAPAGMATPQQQPKLAGASLGGFGGRPRALRRRPPSMGGSRAHPDHLGNDRHLPAGPPARYCSRLPALACVQETKALTISKLHLIE